MLNKHNLNKIFNFSDDQYVVKGIIEIMIERLNILKQTYNILKNNHAKKWEFDFLDYSPDINDLNLYKSLNIGVQIKNNHDKENILKSLEEIFMKINQIEDFYTFKKELIEFQIIFII